MRNLHRPLYDGLWESKMSVISRNYLITGALRKETHMIRNVLFILFSLSIALGLAGCGSDDSSQVVDTTLHDNWLYLQPYYNVSFSSVSYEEIEHQITSGQPWDGVTSSYNGAFLNIDARAGRKGSSSVATWFKDNCSVAICTLDCGGDWPSELNFAFTGTIWIEGTSYPITIGQGHSAAGLNNWWIGGPGWISLGSGVIQAPNNSKYVIYGTSSLDAFFLDKWDSL